MVNSTGHGLPQMAKPSNLYLRLLWAAFFVVAVCGGGMLIQQAAEQYTKYTYHLVACVLAILNLFLKV